MNSAIDATKWNTVSVAGGILTETATDSIQSTATYYNASDISK